MDEVTTVDVHHHRVLLPDTGFCLEHKKLFKFAQIQEKVSSYIRRENVEIETILIHIAHAFRCSDILNWLRASRSIVDSLEKLPASVSSRWLEATFVGRRKRVRNAEEGRALAEDPVDVLMPWPVERVRIGIVVEVNFETLNLSVIRLHENVSIQQQAIASQLSLKILSETPKHAWKRRLNVVRIGLETR